MYRQEESHTSLTDKIFPLSVEFLGLDTRLSHGVVHCQEGVDEDLSGSLDYILVVFIDRRVLDHGVACVCVRVCVKKSCS